VECGCLGDCGAGGDGAGEEEVSKRFFFEKKKQKTFANWPRARFRTSVSRTKSFLVTFFQKSNFFLIAA
jgi:hypothetical protein